MDGRINQLVEDVAQLKAEFGRKAAVDHWVASLEAAGWEPHQFMDLVLALRSQKDQNTILRHRVKVLEEQQQGWGVVDRTYVYKDLNNNSELMVTADGTRLVVWGDWANNVVVDLPPYLRLAKKEEGWQLGG